MKRIKLQNKQNKKTYSSEAIEVYCRVRPVNPTVPVCLKIISSNVVQLSAPSSAISNKNGSNCKAIQFTFKKVFSESTKQRELFEEVALPLVENVLNGKNGLLFTYGVTGSGKTYTMTGAGRDGGIMPRCISAIFNSIGPYKASKHVFKPDKLNGFEVQSEADALLERQHDFISQLTPARSKQIKLGGKLSDEELLGRVSTSFTISNIDEDNSYAVFITFVEIYNNSVYDLLEEGLDDGVRPRPPQIKIIREDSDHNMFVHGVNEVEVSSVNEAYELFYRGQSRRRVAHTTLNAESSRAHTIFTIRIVQAPIDGSGQQQLLDKKHLTISQLSLVDLAGSERTNRTMNTGLRLREAGNINNSLMTLRTCLELLRENQKGGNKMIPYRDSRLTHLFRSYFEGDGHVVMVVCANPMADEYDETLQVMKFAEMSQEVQIICPTPRVNIHTPGRKKYNQAIRGLLHFEKDTEGDKENSPTFFSAKPFNLFSELNSLMHVASDDETSIKKTLEYVESNLKFYNDFTESINQQAAIIRDMMLKNERQTFKATQELESVKSLYEKEKERASEYEGRMKDSNSHVNSIKRKLDENELQVKRLKRELSEKDLIINKNKIENEKMKEKLKVEMERKSKCQKSAWEYELRNRVKRRVLSDETLPRTPPQVLAAPSVPHTVHKIQCPSVFQTPLSGRPPSPNFRSTGRKAGPPVVSKRYMRRSKSAENWLEHRPVVSALPLNTIFQPNLTKRKSVTKLTDVKDVTSGPDKYCLVTQNQDSEGDLETRLYKGDVVPTVSGGAQVMFSDVEILKQKSPSASPPKRRIQFKPNSEAACSFAIEGHKLH